MYITAMDEVPGWHVVGVLGTVRGEAGNSGQHQPPGLVLLKTTISDRRLEAEALAQLQAEARRLGADAVVGLRRLQAVAPGSHGGKAVCSGTAVRLAPPAA